LIYHEISSLSPTPFSFSNRVFIDKAIAGWTGKSDEEHIEIVSAYLHAAGNGNLFKNLSGYNVLEETGVHNRNGDPLYAITATRS
jgi:hypothetical protein